MFGGDDSFKGFDPNDNGSGDLNLPLAEVN